MRQGWNKRDSEHLDTLARRYAQRFPTTPIRFDPQLAELLADYEPEPVVWPRPCVRCGAAMRPGRCRAAEWPGTVAHSGREVCQSCRGKRAYLRN